MPGTNGGEPDEIDAILNEVGNDDGSAEGQSFDPGSNSLTTQEPAKSHGAPANAANGKAQQPTVDYKSRFVELKKQYDPVAQRKNQLEEILKNPELLNLAKTNPRLKDALIKAGFTKAEEEEEAYQANGPQVDDGKWDPENNPMHRVQELELNYKYDREEAALERELKRDLTEDEKTAIYEKLSVVRGLSVREAFTLTPQYQKALKAAEDRRVQEAIAKLPPGRRPKPNPFGSGQKLDLKKDVRELKGDEERASFIQNILDNNS